ncbi:IVa2, partial [Great tit adenovirus 1]
MNELEEFYTKTVAWKAAVDDINTSILPNCKPPSFKEFESYNSSVDLRSNMRKYNEINLLNQDYLQDNELPSINMGAYPLISLIIGPTGCGKSQLLRNLLGFRKIQPMPESVIFITPTKGMISHDEITLWKAQLQEGNYSTKNQCIYPKTNVFNIDFIECAFDDVINTENLDINNEKSIFSTCCKKGPVCVILDECMQKLIQ